MRITVSILEELFAKAERVGHRLGISLSQLCSEALRDYLARHAPDSVTEALNRIYQAEDSRADPFVAAAARRAFGRTES